MSESNHTKPPQPSETSGGDSQPVEPVKQWSITMKISIGAAVAAVVVLIVFATNRNWAAGVINRLFGPPQVESTEAYSDTDTTAPTGFEHTVFDDLLKAHVDEHGWVDYAALKDKEPTLDGYIAAIATAPFEKMVRDEKLALLINAYNAFTLKLILDYHPVDSIKDIPKARSWDDVRWNVAGKTLSLNQIEHQEIRPKFAEPRIHFALVCAAVGCPPLLNRAYLAETVDAQLATQTAYVHRHKTWFEYDADKKVAKLTKLYSWYGTDFEQQAGSVLDYVANHAQDLKAATASGNTPTVEWLDYDWALNSVKNRVPR